MVRVVIGTVQIECTPDEAIEIADKINARQGIKPPSRLPDLGPSVVLNETIFSDSPPIRFLRAIKELPPTIVTSETLAEALDVKGASGIGPRLAKLEDQFRQLTPSIDLHRDVLEKEQRPGQPVIWRIRPGINEVLKRFNVN